MTEATLYVIDEFDVLPGQGEAFLDYYMTHYAPGAEKRGMTLERVLVSPPMWLDDQSNTLVITWTLPNVGAWWQMSFMGRYDPTVADWWEGADKMVSRRTRKFASASNDVKGLSNV